MFFLILLTPSRSIKHAGQTANHGRMQSTRNVFVSCFCPTALDRASSGNRNIFVDGNAGMEAQEIVACKIAIVLRSCVQLTSSDKRGWAAN